MAITLPTKLATTMGVELTFLPAIHERIYAALGGKVNTSELYSERELREFLCNVMAEALRQNQIPYKKCHLDPQCVEVPTHPYDSVRKLTRVISKIRRMAKRCEMVPVVSYSVGGGAHIHTGVLGKDETEKSKYIAAMMLWAQRNPWLSWAFSGFNDISNANPVSADHIYGTVDAREISDAIWAYERAIAWMRESRENILYYTAEAHKKGVSPERRYMNQMSAINAAKMLVRRRKTMLVMANKILRYYMTPTQDTVEYSDIRPCIDKDTVVRYAACYGTIEFRCFLMTPDMEGHRKHIALVNAIVSHVWEQAKACTDGIFPTPTDVDLGMTYSEAKRGFNSMLVSLGFDPLDFRSECVNIARKFRYMRKVGER